MGMNPTTEDTQFALLKNKLLEDMSRSTNTSYYQWRSEVIQCAEEIDSLSMLEHLERNPKATNGNFHQAYTTTSLAWGDADDPVRFDRALTLCELTQYSKPSDSLIASVLPLVDERPDRIEEIAHYLITGSPRGEYHLASVEEIRALLLASEEEPTALPAAIAESYTPSTHPVTDYRYAAFMIAGQSDWSAYLYFKNWDRKTMSYIADAMREGSINLYQAKIILHKNMEPSTAAEYAVLMRSISDLRDDNHRGTKTSFHAICWEKLKLLETGTKEGLLKLDTPQDIAEQSALLRFIATLHAPPTEVLHQDPELIDLIKRRNTVREITELVRMFNSRDTFDPHAGEEYLDSIMGSEAVAEGWL